MSVQKTAEDPPAEAELTCNETNALLQVKYNITEDEWDSSRPKPTFIFREPFLYLQGSRVEYETFASVRNYEACLPRDECSEVLVGGLPTDAYQLSFDGEKLISAKSSSSIAQILSPPPKWALVLSLSAKISRLSWRFSIGKWITVWILFLLRTKMVALFYSVS